MYDLLQKALINAPDISLEQFFETIRTQNYTEDFVRNLSPENVNFNELAEQFFASRQDPARLGRTVPLILIMKKLNELPPLRLSKYI